ncbi:eukaryotic translation initiation factor 3 [Rhizoctonia solani AG-1 IA]|uniref:Eukaryotic translation initiation factor 3 subunit I n=1 Tax=Thanatephorus cucumeris (strain AG1-IA) TaxID=983506 RepID=L8WNM5_THACA|nr:eukaryotic translation initiation factor 3 [Rhizoctonia solani AG-1 IA]
MNPEDLISDHFFCFRATTRHICETWWHERSLTQIKYNAEGDLLFTASKDHVINVWYTHNGERVGTYNGHNGSVWTVDVDTQSRFLLSGAADNMMKLWEASTGKCLYTWEFPTAVKRVAWSEDDKQILCITEQRMGYQGAIRVFNINREDPSNQDAEPYSEFNPVGSKATVAAFSYDNDIIITGHESGKVAAFDVKAGEEVNSNQRAHLEPVTDLQMSSDRTYFITSSKDKSAKLHETKTLNVLKHYATDGPLNSAAIAPILVGGGQEAMNVTTTSARQGKFETRFWHKIFEEEVGRVKGHFGPINTIAVHPAGIQYASGGEDGFVRLHTFDESYFKARPYGDLGEPDE